MCQWQMIIFKFKWTEIETMAICLMDERTIKEIIWLFKMLSEVKRQQRTLLLYHCDSDFIDLLLISAS